MSSAAEYLGQITQLPLPALANCDHLKDDTAVSRLICARTLDYLYKGQIQNRRFSGVDVGPQNFGPTEAVLFLFLLSLTFAYPQ